MPKQKRSPKKSDEIADLEAQIKEGRAAIEQRNAEKKQILEIARVYEKLDEELRWLIGLAKDGDKVAFFSLLPLAFTTVIGVEEIATLQSDIVRSAAKNLFVWPSLISHKRGIIKHQETYLESVQLGKGGTLSDSEWQPYALSTRLALWLYGLARLLESQDVLPPLASNTKELWFDISWNVALERGFQPETDKVFASLGQSKTTKKPKYCKNLHPATRAANVRAEIKRRGWEAFDAVVVAR